MYLVQIIMKKIVLIGSIFFIGVILSSCSGGYSCPTYSKKEVKPINKLDQERV